jgi:hypothetical protein
MTVQCTLSTNAASGGCLFALLDHLHLVLQLQRNALKDLPLAFGDIGTLEELNISNNELEVGRGRALSMMAHAIQVGAASTSFQLTFRCSRRLDRDVYP